MTRSNAYLCSLFSLALLASCGGSESQETANSQSAPAGKQGKGDGPCGSCDHGKGGKHAGHHGKGGGEHGGQCQNGKDGMHAGHGMAGHGKHQGDHPCGCDKKGKGGMHGGHAGHGMAGHGKHSHGGHEANWKDGHAHGKGPMGHRFDNAEEWAKRFDDPKRDAWQKPATVVAAMGLSEGMSVADIGAGTGYFLGHLSKAVGVKGKVIGLDIEADMVRYMKERALKQGWLNTSAQQCPLDGPGLPDASMDRIIIVDTWHHIAEREAYAGKLAATLKAGGAVYIVDFKMDSPHGPPKEHRLEPTVIIKELEAGGLKAELVSVDLPYQYIVRGSK